MVGINGELTAIQVQMESLHSIHNGQSLFLDLSILLFSCRQCPGDKCNGPFFSSIHLVTQYSTYAIWRGIAGYGEFFGAVEVC